MLPWDRDGIYNDPTIRPPKTFDDLLSRIDEFAKVKDDDLAANRAEYKRDRGNDKKQEGSSKKEQERRKK